MAEIVAFATAKEASDSGFKDGTEDKKNGVAPEDFARELREGGEAFKWRRGPGSPFYDDWRHGYERGYRAQ